MISRHRILTVYRKDLIDILRDRRTLIAMIVVPIVLYPLLMLGSVQAVSYQAESMETEKFVVGVVEEDRAHLLRQLLDADAEVTSKPRPSGRSLESARRHRDRSLVAPIVEPGTGRTDPNRSLSRNVTVVFVDSREELEGRIRERMMHAGVVLPGPRLIDDPTVHNEIVILADREEARSAFVAAQLEALFERTGERIVKERKRRLRLPEPFDAPFTVNYENLSAPSSILGQILPLILVLMTITGAIYPAIDVTAGERERGTLESLMVCPVPSIDLIVGKFLVVTTVAILGAALNLTSVTATVYLGGFNKVIATSGAGLPLGTMFFILVCLIPFAVFMSAIMIAVCSYARTFKEAQNYVTPIILAVLIPGGIAAMPTTRMDGMMLVMPVGNMVLLARDLLLGTSVPLWKVGMVLVSTGLYAGAAVAVASSVFGKESVVFADAAPLRSLLNRKALRPRLRPTTATSLLVVALLFPTWFFIQAGVSTQAQGGAATVLYATGWLMPLVFVLFPVLLLLFLRVNVGSTLGIRRPRARFLVAATLMGLSAWVPAHEIGLLQHALFGTPSFVVEQARALGAMLIELPPLTVITLIALVPAVCEELLFRGFLLSGLLGDGRSHRAILVSAAIFGVFHFFVFKFAVTTALGMVLGYLVCRSGSIVPSMLMHGLHNAIGAMGAINTRWYETLGISADSELAHLPPHVMALSAVMLAAGFWAASRTDDSTSSPADFSAGKLALQTVSGSLSQDLGSSAIQAMASAPIRPNQSEPGLEP